MGKHRQVWDSVHSTIGQSSDQRFLVESPGGILKILSLMPLLLGGLTAAIAPPVVARAQSIPSPQLIAQQVYRDLPPPPPITFGEQPLPSQQLPSQQLPSQQLPVLAPAAPGTPQREVNFQAPPPDLSTPTLTPAAATQRYVVLVNGDSPLLLAQVQRLEPGAFRREYDGRGIIQAGVFSSEVNAQQRTQELRNQGIGSQVVSLAAGQQLPGEGNPTPTGQIAKSYLVVIPGSRTQLSGIASRLTSLGVQPRAVYQRQAPLGPHIAIGPFTDRGAAERLSNDLQHYGMNARVHYGRL